MNNAGVSFLLPCHNNLWLVRRTNDYLMREIHFIRSNHARQIMFGIIKLE